MSLTDVQAPIKRRVLPAGASGSSWSTRPACGLLDFYGTRPCIKVTEGVLFLTDCELSLLAALQGGPL